ncbi:hypothetical protein M1M07_04655 [Rhodococcus sp. HM1]|uniref:hypothetical protein n=1 Tax=unclassified Rhodococcus (in: high G+C Gram-positive bacteria) TaxID=192944 RepID=UPI0018CD3327|nr:MULTISPECIES: hypothetical protein [unclassified Rhodococcus (in: high G+C Gram-positive bacteria)]MBH0123515.1 hypothetical protein [Rhodococcus sp. CX]MCK8670405.1 hypothetical protein [Rhodococcus sp. HM1]
MTSTESRADRFTRELSELKIPDPAAGRSSLWLRLGIALMVIGPILGVVAYFMSHNTSDALVQRDAIVVSILGVAVAIVGAALYLRYSLTGFLRFWMARQSFDLGMLAERTSESEVEA